MSDEMIFIRIIYVAKQEVAESEAFFNDKDITFCLNLIHTDDDHYTMLRPSEKALIHNNIR